MCFCFCRGDVICISPDIILSGWLGSKDQLINCYLYFYSILGGGRVVFLSVTFFVCLSVSLFLSSFVIFISWSECCRIIDNIMKPCAGCFDMKRKREWDIHHSECIKSFVCVWLQLPQPITCTSSHGMEPSFPSSNSSRLLLKWLAR